MKTVLSAIVVLFLFFTFRIEFLSDDAFISFRFAENLSGGHGLVYNEGERVEGYTNFLWVVILSVASKLGFDLLAFARALSVVSAIVLIILTYRISRSVFALSVPAVFIAPFLTALNPGVVLWSYSGMETLFFALTVNLGVVFIMRFLNNSRSSGLYFASVFFLIASLTRPEGAIFFFVSFLYVMIFDGDGAKRKIGESAGLMAAPVLLFIVCYSVYFLWRYNYYGQLLPNTFYAKTGFENQELKGFYYCFKFVRESMAGGFLLMFAAYAVLAFIGDIRIRYAALVIAVYVIYLILIGGDNLLVQRFMVPVVPLIFTLVAFGIGKLSAEFRPGFLISGLFGIFLIVYPASVLLDTRAFPMLGVRSTMLHYENMKLAGLWLKQNSKEGETLAVESAGIIPYFSGLKSYDRLGLNDLHISRRGKYGEGERDKSDEEYITWTLRPDYLVDAFPTLGPSSKPDLRRDSLVYQYCSVPVGKGSLETRNGVVEFGDVYFNFYRKTKE